MGRKKGPFTRLPSGLKVKTLPPPPPPPQPGTYGFKLTMHDNTGLDPLYRDVNGVVAAESKEDATEQVFRKVPDGWRVVKFTISFIGLITFIVWLGSRMLA